MKHISIIILSVYFILPLKGDLGPGMGIYPPPTCSLGYADEVLQEKSPDEEEEPDDLQAGKCLKLEFKNYYVYELWDGCRWHLTDPQHGAVYLDWDNKTDASYDDVIDDPLLALRAKIGGIEQPFCILKSWVNYAQLASAEYTGEVAFGDPNPLSSTDENPAPEQGPSLKAASTEQGGKLAFDISILAGNCSKIRWQISADPGFTSVIPNFDRLQDFGAPIQISELELTFFNPGTTYYFRAKGAEGSSWGKWTEPAAFVHLKPDRVEAFDFEPTPNGTFELTWKGLDDENTSYLLFASNSLDSVPSIYCDQQLCSYSDGSAEASSNNNFLLETKEPRAIIDGCYSYCRIVAYKDGSYSIPSPLIYLYGLETSPVRDCLKADLLSEGKENPTAKRVSLPRYAPNSGDAIVKGEGGLVFPKGQYATPEQWKAVEPYLLPENHPARAALDRIFANSRCVSSSKEMKKAGFQRCKPNKKDLVVTGHPRLKGFLIKAYLDSSPLPEVPLWRQRIQGAQTVNEAVVRKGYQNIMKVPKKWIYPIPSANPKPTVENPKNFVMVVQDMGIVSQHANYYRYSHNIDRAFMHALYRMLMDCKLIDSIYLDNIPFCHDDKIAFVDTEWVGCENYPLKLHVMTKWFAKEMQAYWLSLLESGGN